MNIDNNLFTLLLKCQCCCAFENQLYWWFMRARSSLIDWLILAVFKKFLDFTKLLLGISDWLFYFIGLFHPKQNVSTTVISFPIYCTQLSNEYTALWFSSEHFSPDTHRWAWGHRTVKSLSIWLQSEGKIEGSTQCALSSRLLSPLMELTLKVPRLVSRRILKVSLSHLCLAVEKLRAS